MLPIEKIRDDLCLAASQSGCCVLLSAPTGSGKSTRVPAMLADVGLTDKACVIVVQPRRLAARLLAAYVARQWPCKLGETVGYTVRFDSCCSANTRVLFMTDGLLERRMTDDPELRGVSAIVFDEVHERRLSGDLCLARALELQRSIRPDLSLFIMSATLELDKLEAYLPHAHVLRAQGRLYPVDISYMPPVPQRDRRGVMALPAPWEQVCVAVKHLITDGEQGDILVFLPGAYEIKRAEEMLSSFSWMKGRDVYPLHGQLSAQAQAQAVELGSRPRVILSTNIAETSLTIEGVRAVVDTGTARESCWDPRRGLSTLHVVPISQAQAEQRAGRAGRLGAGRCIRLWSEGEHRRRVAFPSPEVHRADLSSAFLNLLAWGCRGLKGIEQFPWPDAPVAQECERAWQLLLDLGAVQGDVLSGVGQRMLRYPLPPVLSRILIAGQDAGCEAEMAAVAALMQGEAIALKSGLSDKLQHPDDYTDFQAEWRALQAAQACRFESKACSALGIMGRAAREIAAAYRQFTKGGMSEPDFESHRQSLVEALLHAMPSHVAVRNNRSTASARLSRGRGGKLETSSVAYQSKETELFIAAQLTEIGGKNVETRLSRCTCLRLDDLSTQRDSVAVYEASRKRVLNMEREVFGDLVLSEKELGEPQKEAAAELLAHEIVRGKLILPSWDGHVLQWINRLTCLRQAMPELGLPSFGEEDRLVAITMLCEGATSYKEIEKRPLMPILSEWLSAWQRECLNKYAPKQLKLSNGREVKLLYREDGTPVFGLKCQLLFGVAETPTVAEGRVNCLVEVLAPNQRPYQVTSDLPSFWRGGYAQMKKDLAGRYPRHPWPDEP